MLNKVLIKGNIATDLELTDLSNGSKVLNFSVATNRRYKKWEEYVEEATFHRCVSFGWQAEFIANNFEKWKSVSIEWRHQVRDWEDREGNKRQTTEVVVEEVKFDWMNKAVMLWNIATDLELKELPNGSKVLNFSVATNRKYKKWEEYVEEATFHRCVSFGWQAEFISKYFEKWSAIAILWRTQVRDWEDKEWNKRQTTEVVVEEVSFAWKK